MSTDIDFAKLAELIKACKSANVTDLKIGSIEVKFAERNVRIKRINQIESEIPIPTAEQLETATRDSEIGDQLADAEDQMDLMPIENPVLFEQLLVERELELSGARKEEIPLN